MPTGYTAGIIDGTITTFPQYAKQCARAFGAMMHMRDDDSNKEWEPRIPSDYHLNALKTAETSLEKVLKMTETALLKEETKRIKSDIQRMKGYIKEGKKSRAKLDAMLLQAQAFTPPTPNHEEIKKFLIQQLETTIEHDGDTTYYENTITELETELGKLNAADVKSSRIAQCKKDIAYHTKEHSADVKRCDEANEWVRKYFESLNA